MKKIENIVVALDLSDLDDKLITYASFIAERLKAQNVYFVHNIKKYEISKLFEEHLKDVNLDEVIGEELNEKIKEKFTASTAWDVLISEDPYSESLIKYVVEKYDIQLALVGNKKQEKGTGVVAGKLLRLLRCDILAVPMSTRERIEVVWAGTDFSQDSKKIFKVTQALEKDQQIALKVVHVYSVPVQFSPYVSPETMGPRVEKHAKEKFAKFLRRLDYPGNIEPLIFMGRESGVARKILTNLRSSEVDLLVVSNKGGNTFSPFTVGTVTEELFNAELDVPLWIAK